jgi:hypothetical protein
MQIENIAHRAVRIVGECNRDSRNHLISIAIICSLLPHSAISTQCPACPKADAASLFDQHRIRGPSPLTARTGLRECNAVCLGRCLPIGETPQDHLNECNADEVACSLDNSNERRHLSAGGGYKNASAGLQQRSQLHTSRFVTCAICKAGGTFAFWPRKRMVRSQPGRLGCGLFSLP